MMLEKSTSVTLDKIFDEMYNLISEASRIPLTDKIIIEESELAAILDDLKDAIPTEVKSATRLLEEQKQIIKKAYEDADNIVLQAKTEADRILEIAKTESDRMLRQEEIVKQAEAFVEDVKSTALRNQQEIKEETESYAARVKTDALQYADDMLLYLSENLSSALQAINENRSAITTEKDKYLLNPNLLGEQMAPMDEENEEQ